jgi:hypothetical protein
VADKLTKISDRLTAGEIENVDGRVPAGPAAATVAPVNESVNLLSSHDGAKLASLRDALGQSFPEQRETLELLLRSGELQGEADDPLLLPRAKVSLAALETAARMCDTSLAVAGRRLRLARNARLVSEVAAAVGSASVLGTLSASWQGGAVISGVVALLGSFGALAAKFLTETRDDARGTMSERFSRLIELRYEARRVHAELAVHLENVAHSIDAATIAQLVGDANALAREINLLDPSFF